MTQTAGPGARVAAAVAGGVVGFCIGPLTADMLAGIVWGQSGGPWSDEVGGWVGRGVGLFVGAFLGAFLVGHSLVARWCRRTACAVGAVAFLAGFAGPILLWPDNPQGPLLGLFLTGPLGFVVGTLVGLGIGLTKERRQFGRVPV
jgi:hypothetical protein